MRRNHELIIDDADRILKDIKRHARRWFSAEVKSGLCCPALVVWKLYTAVKASDVTDAQGLPLQASCCD